jgi:hypothetical protein
MITATKTSTYNIHLPFASMMSFDIELEAGLTEEQVIQQLKAKYLELVDLSAISFCEMDGDDVVYEIQQHSTCDFIIDEEEN